MYGWWLPNDPRGSSSHLIRNDLLDNLGALHHGRRRAQPAGWAIREFYERAAHQLKHPLVTFNDAMIASAGAAFAEAIAACKYTCYACSIMPDHVHLVICEHRDTAEQMIANLQRASHLRLRADGHFDFDHRVWGGPGWKVFLDEPDDIWRTIDYVRRNPTPLCRATQDWSFVTAYDNWPLHPGHNPNSPYARRLRGR